jgi:hypothetical protein
MALTPGGGRAPSAPPPPRPTRDARERPPAPTAALSAFRWGLLVGGLLIIADLTTRLVLQRVGQDASDTVAAIDEVVNGLLLVTAGMSVQRETGRVWWAAAAGLLAGLLDALVIFAANTINPPPGPQDPVGLLIQNIGQGPLVALAAAVISNLLRRRARP